MSILLSIDNNALPGLLMEYHRIDRALCTGLCYFALSGLALYVFALLRRCSLESLRETFFKSLHTIFYKQLATWHYNLTCFAHMLYLNDIKIK